MSVIYTSPSGNIEVEYEPGSVTDDGEPVAISLSLVHNDPEDFESWEDYEDNDTAVRWLDEDEAREMVGAIAAALGAKVEVGPRPNITGTDLNADLIRVAIAHGERILFRYAKGKDGAVIESRSLEPTEIKTVGDHETVIGYDPDRDEARAYRLDRIKGNLAVVA